MAGLRRPGLRSATWLALYFVTSLALVRGLGLDTLGGLMGPQWQLLDFAWLESEPVRSLLLLHAQPPLLNALAALLLHLPVDPYGGFLVVNCLATAFTAWVVMDVLQRYLPRPWMAVAAGLIYVASPAAMLYSAYAFYPSPTTAGYAALVHSIFRSRTAPRSALFEGAAAIAWLSLLRSSFSPLHAVVAIAWLAWLVRGRVAKGAFALATGVCLVAVLAVPFKNLAMYGFFGSSSWGASNLVRGTGIDFHVFIDPETIARKHPELKCRFSYGPQDAQLTKSNGQANFNSCLEIEYAQLQRERLREQYSLYKHWTRISNGLQLYLSPPEDYDRLANRAAIGGYADAWQRLALTSHVPRLYIRIRLLVVLVCAVALAWAVVKRDLSVGFALGLVAVHCASHVLTDGEEANRFVFDVEFVFFIFAGIAAAWAASLLRSARPAGGNRPGFGS